MSAEQINSELLEKELNRQLAEVRSPEQLEHVRRAWLGKDGQLKLLFKELGKLSSEERPAVAAKLNDLKTRLEEFITNTEAQFASASLAKKLEEEFFDLSLPSSSVGRGATHPITQVERKVIEILKRFGVELVYGPEVETEYFCFDSLNVPPHHPARDMQDTFYTSTSNLLRTHTSSVQTRTLKRGGDLPIKICCPGKAFRNETIDASHTAMFHQFELMWIDEGLTLSHLMGLLALVAKELYGKRRKIRFKPKYYPYTEPSLGLDIACAICAGKGCSSCGGAGWVTVVGAGMVHRKVLAEFGYDRPGITGFAFGFGTTRLAAQQFNIPRGKMLYENDLRVYRVLP